MRKASSAAGISAASHLVRDKKNKMQGDPSWHLRYYDFSFLIYVSACLVVVLFYVAVYCLRVPVNRIPDLHNLIDADPVINKSIMKKMGIRSKEDVALFNTLHKPKLKPSIVTLNNNNNSNNRQLRRPSWLGGFQNACDPVTATPEALGARFRFIGALNRHWKSPEQEADTLSQLLGER